MSITYYGTATVPADNGSNSSTDDITITPPASMEAGQFVGVFVLRRSGTSTLTVSNTGGQSWNTETQFTDNGNGLIRFFWCIFDGTWDANPVFTDSETGTITLSAWLVVFDPTTPGNDWAVDVDEMSAAAAAAASPEDITIATFDTNTDGALVLAFYAARSVTTWADQSGYTAPGGITQIRNVAGNDTSMSLLYDIQPTAGATGAIVNRRTGTVSGGSTYAIAIKEIAAAATHLGFDQQPTDAPYDIVIAPPVTVFALNDAEEVDTTYTDDVTIAIATNPGTGVLSGTLTQAAVAGVATFDDLTIDEVGVGYTLEATAAGLTDSPESSTFDILDQVATYLEFVVQPSNAEEDVVIAPDITVEANQPDTTRDTDYVGDITLAIGTNPSGGVLSGTLTKTAVAGLATFNDLDIDKPGTGYTLIATGAGLTQDESATFNITQEAAVELDYLVEPVDTQVNTIITPPIRVRALDSEGDVDTNYVANIVLSKASGPGIISGTLTKAAVAGVAEFDDIQGDTAGAYVLRATSGALPTEDSVAFALSDTPPSAQDLGADVLMGGWPGRMRLG